MAGFYDRSQALFLNTGKSSCNIARCRLTASHILSYGFSPFLHPIYDFIDFLAYGAVFSAYCPFSKNVLAA